MKCPNYPLTLRPSQFLGVGTLILNGRTLWMRLSLVCMAVAVQLTMSNLPLTVSSAQCELDVFTSATSCLNCGDRACADYAAAAES